MTPRRKALSATVICIAAGGMATWAFMPSKVHATPPTRATGRAAPDLWAKGQVDRDNMIQGILDYRTSNARR